MFGLFGKPSKDKFATLVLDKITEIGGPSDLVYHKDGFELRGATMRAFLGNAYDHYCAGDRRKRQSVLANMASVFAAQADSSSKPFEEVREKLVTVVRERALFAFTSLLWKMDGVEKPPTVQNDPISNWFAKAIVIDAPGHMALVTEDQIRTWAHSSDEIYAIGSERLIHSKAANFAEKDGVFTGTWDDDYDSSRILVPGLFDDLPISGEPVVCIPNRLTLMVADSSNPGAVKRLLERAEQVCNSMPRQQNPAPLLIRDGEIADYVVASDSPVFNQVGRAKRLAAASYYAEQKQSLEKLYEKQKNDIFVASYSVHESASGAYSSAAVWTRGIPTLLPVTDRLCFVDSTLPKGQNVVAELQWEDAVEKYGGLMLDTEMFPQRFFVSQFPQKLTGPC